MRDLKPCLCSKQWGEVLYLTVAVADPWAEGGGAGDELPVGRLEACLFLPLLVPLLHLALAHPAWGQKDGVITTRYGSYRQRRRERESGKVRGEKEGHVAILLQIREHLYRLQIFITFVTFVFIYVL